MLEVKWTTSLEVIQFSYSEDPIQIESKLNQTNSDFIPSLTSNKSYH